MGLPTDYELIIGLNLKVWYTILNQSKCLQNVYALKQKKNEILESEDPNNNWFTLWIPMKLLWFNNIIIFLIENILLKKKIDLEHKLQF